MIDSHPSVEALASFTRGQLSQEEAHRIVEHLLEDCPECKRIASEAWQHISDGLRASRSEPQFSEDEGDDTYAASVDRAITAAREFAKDSARAKNRAEELFQELESHPKARQLTLVRNSKRFQSAELCELLIDKSYALRFDDVQAGVELGELAVAVAERLPALQRDESWAVALQGRAWAYFGNIRRVASDLAGSEQALANAETAFKNGSYEPLDRALVCRFRALLFRARRRFDQCYELQDRAIRIYRRCGETRLASQILSDKGLGLLYQGEPETALTVLEEAAELARGIEDDRLSVLVRHNLALCLSELGRHEEALEALRGLNEVYLRLGDILSSARLRWLEGKIYLALGLDLMAATALEEARNTFIIHEIAYDAALISLDLAATYAQQHRTHDIRLLAEQMLPIFVSRDVHREALAALIVFREAALAETLTIGLVEQIAAYLRAARNRPDLVFRQQ